MPELKKVDGKLLMPLSCGPTPARFGAHTAKDARALMANQGDRFGTITGEAQEYLTGEGKAANGDALCGDWGLFKRVAAADKQLASAMILDRLQSFFEGPEILSAQMKKYGIQEYTTKADFPDEILDTIEKYHTGIADIDVEWRNVFQVKDFTSTPKNGFKIRDISSGLTFRKVPTGDSIEVYKQEGSEVSVEFDNYGGALGWDRKWFQDEEYWEISDTAIEFRNKYYNDMADVHYALVEALGAAINVAWQAPSPAGLAATDPFYEISRDIETINLAAYEIIIALEDQGMGVTANTPLRLLVPLALKARIGRALGVGYNTASLRTPIRVEYAAEPGYTTRLASATEYYLYLPGKKSKSGIRTNLESFADFDILSYSDTTAGWGRYGAGIGEADQFRRCSTSS